MYLGQMSSGDEAVQYMEKGLQLMLQEHQGDGSSSGSSVTSADIASAYCALAEVYLTDSWLGESFVLLYTTESCFFYSFADTADSQCHQCCQKAIEYGPSNPEAYQLMASYLLSKERDKVGLLCGCVVWYE